MWHSLGNTAAVPPSSAVVVETVNAAWGGPNSSGSDIPNGTTPTSQPPNYTATRYSVQNGSNFTLTCTPFANFSATNPPGQSLMGGSAFVGYTATAYPVYITLKGATLDGGVYKVLAGQQVVATLNTGVAVNSITYQWAVTGGTGAFETYDSSAPNQQHATQLVPLSGADKQAVSFSFYDRKAETVTVTCTANFQFPDGTTGTATATSPQITVLKPTAAWKITPGYVQKFTLPDVPGYDLVWSRRGSEYAV